MLNVRFIDKSYEAALSIQDGGTFILVGSVSCLCSLSNFL